MAYYTIYKSDGTAVNVNDNSVDSAYYNANGGDTGQGLGLQLIGRNTTGNSAIIAQSILQSVENYASITPPNDTTALLGQLWFNKNTGLLNIRTSTAGTGLSNWQHIVTVDSTGISTITGNLNVSGLITSSGFTGNASSASNIAQGTANSILYQSSPGVTSFLAQGSGVLQEVAGVPTWTVTPVLSGTNFSNIPNSALISNYVTLGSTSAVLGSTTTALSGLTSVTSTSFVGALTGNSSTATNIAYSGLTGTPTVWNQNTTGNAATASAVYFTGLVGTPTVWNQNTTGNASTASNVPYTGLTGTATVWNQNTTGNAATATNVAYTGLTGTPTVWNQDTTGNAATATLASDATQAASTSTVNGVNGQMNGDGFWRSVGNTGWINTTYNVGIYSNSAGVVQTYNNASFYAAGDITAGGTVSGTSDERLKTNWKDLPVGFLEKLVTVKSGTYDRIDVVSNQAGVSAQDMRAILPQVVLEDADGILSMAYGNAAMVAVIALTKRVLELEAKLEALLK